MIKPILFNTDMVRAIQCGTKTVTRRAVKPQPEITPIPTYGGSYRISMDKNLFAKPPYRPGDILYVRETWSKDPFSDGFIYPAEHPGAGHKWHPSIHMPREAARIFLRVTEVRVERLQDMPDEDLVRDFGFCWEAIQAVGRDTLAKPFWDSTIKKADRTRYGWEANPWVWVIEFERISREEAMKSGS